MRYTHPTKPMYWTEARYWGRLAPTRQDNWVFGDRRTGAFLWKYSWFRIQRHILVQGAASKDDPTLRAYWDKREAAGVTSLSPRLQPLARRQRYRCEVCGDSLLNDETLHRHHITPRPGGKDTNENLTLHTCTAINRFTRKRTGQ